MARLSLLLLFTLLISCGAKNKEEKANSLPRINLDLPSSISDDTTASLTAGKFDTILERWSTRADKIIKA